MRLRTKLLRLQITTTTIALLLMWLFTNYYLEDSYKIREKEQASSAITNLEHSFTTINNNLTQKASTLIKDEFTISVVDLINRYQKIKSYQSTLFDEEKKKLALEVFQKINFIDVDSITIFDKEKRAIIHINKNANNIIKISTYTKAEEKSLAYDFDTTEWFETKPIVQKSTIIQQNYSIDSKKLSLFKTKTIQRAVAEAKENIGFIVLEKILDEKYLEKFSKINNFSLMTYYNEAPTMVLDNTINLTDKLKQNSYKLFSNSNFHIELIEDRAFIPITLDNKIYLSLSSFKDELKETKVLSQKILFGTFILIGLIIIITSNIYLKSYILRPLDTFMRLINKIKEGEKDLKPIVSKDEIEEISKNFLELIEELRSREKEIKDYQEHLEERVKEEVLKRKEQDEIIQNQSKMAAMGEIIGNIAHHWRQPLNVVGLAVQNIHEDYKFGDLTEESLEHDVAQISKKIQEMSTTINTFSNFYSTSEEKHEFNVYEKLLSVLAILKTDLELNSVEIAFNEYNEESLLNGYETEFSQIFINIIKNSIDALSDKVEVERKIVVAFSEEKDYLTFTVSDNGGGIDEKIIDKIFDPYFSTKEELNGMGMGLYMSKIVIEKHLQGSIVIENHLGGAKTTIKIKR